MTADLARLRELMEMAAPTIEQCHAAGKGPESSPNWTEGGLPNTPDERARFEAYMKGHCWTVGQYDSEMSCYDTTLVRMLYGVWRDRGAVDQAALLSLLTELEQLRAELGRYREDAERLRDGVTIGVYAARDGHRDWWSGGTWLNPGEEVMVVDAAKDAK